MAAGDGLRWIASGGEGRKHELVIDGETLIARTVRLVRERGVTDIVISGPYDGLGVPTFHPAAETDIVDGRLAVRSMWSDRGRTVILLGDVYYTDTAMRTIIDHAGNEPHLFARFTGSRITGKTWAEPFANSFLAEHRAAHERSLRTVQTLKDRGRIKRAGLWEAYKLDHHRLLPFTYRTSNLGHATVIDDWTEDFDFAKDVEIFLTRRAEAAA